MANHSTKGYLCVVAAALMWGSSGTAGKALFGSGMTPFELVQVRVTLTLLLLAAALGLTARHLFRIRIKDLGYFFLHGGIVMALVQITYFYAISKIQVAAAVFLEYLGPVIIAFFSILFWKERLTVVKLISLALSIVGCYLVAGAYNLQLLQMNRLGVMAGLASAFCFAAYALIGERGMHRYSPWTVLFYGFVFATLSWHVFYTPFTYLRADYTLAEWGWLGYIAVVGTLIPFGLFFMGINHIRSTRAAITATLEPISAGLMAYIFLGEALEPLQVAGGALVVAAVVVLQIQREHDDMSPALIRRSKADMA